MRSQAFQSSVVRNAEYDETLRQLEVEFIGGSIYRYYDVEEPLFDAFIAARSKGEFLNMTIKPNHRFARIGTRRGRFHPARVGRVH
jgi:hypothetical protein